MEEVFKALVELQDQLPENKSGKHSPVGCFQNLLSFYSRKFAFIYLPEQNPLCYKTTALYYLEIPAGLDYLGTQAIGLQCCLVSLMTECGSVKPLSLPQNSKFPTLISYTVHFFKYATLKAKEVPSLSSLNRYD